MVLVNLINHHQSLEIAIHATNVNKPNANWPNLNWIRDSRFAILDSIRFDSLRVRFCFATSAGWNCVCNLFYYLFPSNNIRLGCRKSSTGYYSFPAPVPVPLHRRLSKCNSAANAAVNSRHKSGAPGCTKEARENSITEGKTGRKLKIKICPNNLQGERTKKERDWDTEKERVNHLKLACLFWPFVMRPTGCLAGWLAGLCYAKSDHKLCQVAPPEAAHPDETRHLS